MRYSAEDMRCQARLCFAQQEDVEERQCENTVTVNRNTYALSALLSGKIPSREYPACYMYEMSSATVENGDLTNSAEFTTQIFYILYNFFL